MCRKRKNTKTHPAGASDTIEYKVINSKRANLSDFTDSESTLAVRFSRDYLMSLLHAFIRDSTSIPIEKFEVDLFKITKIFNVDLQGSPITTVSIEKVHHVHKLVNKKIFIEDLPEERVSENVRIMMEANPLIFSQYQIFNSMVDIWNGLLVKWDIGEFKKYDYRCSGRALNVKMLNLAEMNETFISMDVIWLSTQIFLPPVDVLSTSKLIEFARVLHSQLEYALNLFLGLNPKLVDPRFDIKKSVAFNSEDFRKWAEDQAPEQDLYNYNHARLKLLSGIRRCFASNSPQLDLAVKALVDLEMAYRHFEKTLIGNILDITGTAEFEE